jgi:hypothetical protein
MRNSLILRNCATLSLDFWAFMGYIILMNNESPNSKLDKSDPLRDMIQVQPEEEQPYGGWEGCWAGDGSGMDDLADFNQMEGNDCE